MTDRGFGPQPFCIIYLSGAVPGKNSAQTRSWPSGPRLPELEPGPGGPEAGKAAAKRPRALSADAECDWLPPLPAPRGCREKPWANYCELRSLDASYCWEYNYQNGP